jgi:hypothetical protein
MQHGRAVRILGQYRSHIGHGQSIADDQYRVFCRQCLRQLPWIIPIRTVVADRVGPRLQRRRWIPQRQHHAVGHDGRAIRELRGEWLALAAPRDAPDLIENAHEARLCGLRRFRLRQHVLQVIAVQRARQKVLAAGFRGMALRKTQELQRVPRIRRQARRRDVEKKGKLAGGVRHAAAHRGTALDEHDIGRGGRRTAQQIGRQHRTAETAAHNDYDITHR